MKLTKVHLRNFRRLEDVEIDFENEETIFVGPNNSGKTSATTAFRLFLTKSDFKIHDFSVSQISKFDEYGFSAEESTDELPSIEMDLWFSIDADVEYGRVAELVPNVSTDFEEAGIRLTYGVKDSKKLKSAYKSAFPTPPEGKEPKSLSHYLSLPGNLNHHFSLNYFALEKDGENTTPNFLDTDEGKRVIQSLMRVDFVDAQRNFDDQEQARSNRLSTAFSAFYKKNLTQAEINEKANQVIDENNESLTKHYDEHFQDLMTVIKALGVPSINDREMRLVSSLSPEEALRGHTSLLYIDRALKHELPEAYNGLGFKNLVYMAIQVSHYHHQWLKTEDKRPLCQIIFIEEPEVHLHAQVQQTFIMNMWKIVRKAAEDAGEDNCVPQIGITTHSSHVIDTVDFEKIRYFRRCHLSTQKADYKGPLNSSKVLNLRNFKPQKDSDEGKKVDDGETLKFLKQYLKLPHCDLFFADAAILIEGTAEKLLMPRMIAKTAPNLTQNYLSVLEVGGAYSHCFAGLFDFLFIPYLVITDLDSIDPSNNRSGCRADLTGAETSNESIKFFTKKLSISDLTKLKKEQQTLYDNNCFIAFQKPTAVEGHPKQKMHGRTLEETFVYTNMQLFRDGKIKLGVTFPSDSDFEKEYKAVFERIQSSSFKKTKFALDVSSSEHEWITPEYIEDGLYWLEERMSQRPAEELVQEKKLCRT